MQGAKGLRRLPCCVLSAVSRQAQEEGSLASILPSDPQRPRYPCRLRWCGPLQTSSLSSSLAAEGHARAGRVETCPHSRCKAGFQVPPPSCPAGLCAALPCVGSQAGLSCCPFVTRRWAGLSLTGTAERLSLEPTEVKWKQPCV